VLAAIAFNLTRAAGATASVIHAKATTATIRTQLIAVPARLARSARKLVLHLPKDWPWQAAWESLFLRNVRATAHRHDLTTQPPTGATRDHQWKIRTDRPIRHAHQKSSDHKPQITPKECRPDDPG